MLTMLNIVRGAVADKNLVPLMTHFYFHDGFVQGTDNRITIEAPLECRELDGFAVPADRFYKAVDACGGSPKLTVKNSYLTVSKNKFRTRMPVQGAVDFPAVQAPQGEFRTKIDAAPLKKIRPYVATDATRPFACGVFFHNRYLYATNNIAIARVPVDYDGPDLLLPTYCVDELLRLPFDSYTVQSNDSGLYLQPFENKIWVHARASALEWPEPTQFFQDMGELPECSSALLGEVQKLKKFVPDSKNPIIIFDNGVIRTAEGEFSAEVEGYDLPRSAWRAEVLELVLRDATHFDPSGHPGPCAFRGNGIEGKVVGVRL